MSIAAVITAHAEGGWLTFAIESALRNISLLDTEARVYVLLDNPDQLTLQAASAYGDSITLLKVSFGDVCQVRNFAVNSVKEDFIAFLDGDDLWGDSWLSACLNQLRLEDESDNWVFHPKLTYCFGTNGVESSIVMEHIDSESKEFNPYSLVSSNLWSALAFAPKKIFSKFPYVSSSEELGIGFEDWTFNIQTLAGGVRHKVLEETIHFIRRKPQGSRGKEEAGRGATFLPSGYWLAL